MTAALLYVLLIIGAAAVYRRITRQCKIRAIKSLRRSSIERTEKEWEMMERLKGFNTKVKK